ncbi:MAG: hypothetical protein M3Z02_09785 [Actinomycetota bacterium]|nr:hypothetical protein [Actinomycetota bacterium]
MSTSTEARSAAQGSERDSGVWAAARRGWVTHRHAVAARRDRQAFEAHLARAMPSERADLLAMAQRDL